MSKKKLRIAIAGTGNVAHALGLALAQHGQPVEAVWGRSPSKARHLAKAIKAEVLKFPSELGDYDVVIIAVWDASIEEVAKKISAKTSAVVLHTAGAVDLNVLSKRFANAGVLYPFQTFTVGRPVAWKNLPVFFEASSAHAKSVTKKLARSLSKNVFELSSDKRLLLQAAGVFANNFANAVWNVAESLIKKVGLPRQVLFPLLEETLAKAKKFGTAKSQTGPARRGDLKTMKNHLAVLLDANSREVYRQISKKIGEMF